MSHSRIHWLNRGVYLLLNVVILAVVLFYKLDPVIWLLLALPVLAAFLLIDVKNRCPACKRPVALRGSVMITPYMPRFCRGCGYDLVGDVAVKIKTPEEY